MYVFTYIYMHIYVFKIKTIATEIIKKKIIMKKKKDFGKNTWSLDEHCVPSYIIITSVQPHHHHFNGDRDSL